MSYTPIGTDVTAAGPYTPLGTDVVAPGPYTPQADDVTSSNPCCCGGTPPQTCANCCFKNRLAGTHYCVRVFNLTHLIYPLGAGCAGAVDATCVYDDIAFDFFVPHDPFFAVDQGYCGSLGVQGPVSVAGSCVGPYFGAPIQVIHRIAQCGADGLGNILWELQIEFPEYFPGGIAWTVGVGGDNVRASGCDPVAATFPTKTGSFIVAGKCHVFSADAEITEGTC